MKVYNNLITTSPPIVHKECSNRLKNSKQLSDTLADALRDRILAHDQFSKLIGKASKMPPLSEKDVGTIHEHFLKMFDSFNTEISINNMIAQQVMGFEKDLRQIDQDPSWTTCKNSEAAVSNTIREYEVQEGKVSKYKKKLEAGDSMNKSMFSKLKRRQGVPDIEQKLATSQTSLDNLKKDWEQQGSSYIDSFEAVDEKRLTQLKKILQKYAETMSSQYGTLMRHFESLGERIAQFSVEGDMAAFSAYLTSGLGNVEYSNNLNIDPNLEAKSDEEIPSSNINEGYVMAERNEPEPPVTAEQERSPEVKVQEMKIEETIPLPQSPKQPEVEEQRDDFDDDNEHPNKLQISIKSEVIQENPEDMNQAFDKTINLLKSEAPKTTGRVRRGVHEKKGLLSPEVNMTPKEDFSANATVARHNSHSSFGSILSTPTFQDKISLPSPISPGIEVNVSETINISMKEGTIQDILVTGEIVLSALFPSSSVDDILSILLPKDHPMGTISPEMIYVSIRAPLGTLGRIIENKRFISTTDASFLLGQPDLDCRHFQISVETLAQLPQHPVPIIKYEVLSANPLLHTPLLLTPKFKVADNQTDLLVTYQLNKECLHQDAAAISDVAIAVPIEGNVVEPPLTKPPGMWNPDKKMILWKVPYNTPESGDPFSEVRLMARCIMEGQGQPSPAAAKFEMQNILLSKVQVDLNVCLLPAKRSADPDSFPEGTAEVVTAVDSNSPSLIPVKINKLQLKSQAGKYIGE